MPDAAAWTVLECMCWWMHAVRRAESTQPLRRSLQTRGIVPCEAMPRRHCGAEPRTHHLVTCREDGKHGGTCRGGRWARCRLPTSMARLSRRRDVVPLGGGTARSTKRSQSERTRSPCACDLHVHYVVLDTVCNSGTHALHRRARAPCRGSVSVSCQSICAVSTCVQYCVPLRTKC